MKVTVIVPCYNVAPYLQRCMEHVFAQVHRDLELIAVNDGSTDDSLAVLRALEPRSPFPFRIIDQPNQGAPAARNAGLALARGVYLQFLDADDVLLPGKIAEQVRLAQAFGDPDLVIGSSRTLAADGTLLYETVRRSGMHDPWMDLMSNHLNVTSTLLWSREAVAAVGGWDVRLRSSQEYDLMFRMHQRRVSVVYDPAVNTEIHKRSGSITQTNQGGNWIRFVELRARILEHVRRTEPQRDLQPFHQVLFDSLRVLYPLDRTAALRLYRELIPADFTPRSSPTTTRSFLLLHKVLGFDGANRLRNLLR
ncbi:MAG: glycosyltransferase family A protein [Flavobacteriales bacterium]